MLAFRSVQQSNRCAREEFLYELKAGLRAAASGDRPRPTALTRESDSSGSDGPRLYLCKRQHHASYIAAGELCGAAVDNGDLDGAL